MESQLQRGYTPQVMVHALNICSSPKEHRPRLRVLALRYIFMYRKTCKTSKIMPTLDKLVQIAITMFEDFVLDCNSEYMSEIADVMQTCGPGNYGRILLDRIREFETTRVNSLPVLPVGPVIPVPPRAIAIKKTVYSDSQNVHNSKINETVIRSLETLYNIYKNQINLKGVSKSENEDFKNLCIDNIGSVISQHHPSKKDSLEKNIYYIKTSIATFGPQNLTLKDAFISVWLWITEHKYKDELELRFLEEIKDMNGMCTTGHIARLMNVIQGFTEDDKLCIRISQADQCNAVIRKYLTDELSKCKDEKVIEGIVDGGLEYVKFLRKKVAERLLCWQKEYGKDILDHIVTVTNDFAKTTVFVP